MNEKKHLTQFIERANAFDNNTKLKLLLFICGAKPNTFVHLRITTNIDDKREFERLLDANNIVYSVSRPKGFEEIIDIKKNIAIWRFTGTWYGYDLFNSLAAKKQFDMYVSLLRKQKHTAADTLAGKLYGYPSCCVKKFTQNHHAAHQSYYAFYKKLHDFDKKFPFISHTPCALICGRTKTLNTKYQRALRKTAPAFLRSYATKRTYTADCIVDSENDFGTFKKKDGHDYTLITTKPLEGKYQLISALSKENRPQGTILRCTITLQYDYALINNAHPTGRLKNFHHERKFTLP